MSRRRMRSNQRVLLASRRATLAITVAALGLGAGSSLAEAADEAPTPTSAQVTTEEHLVIELVIEAPTEPIGVPPAGDQPDGDGTSVDTPATFEPPPVPDSLTEPAPDAELPVAAELENTTTTEPTDDDPDHEPTDDDPDHEAGEGGHEDDEGGHDGGSEGGHEDDEGGHDGGSEGGHEDDEGGHDGGSEGGHEGGEGGHDGGSGGQGRGTPYSMTFSVDWRSEAGTPIAVLGDARPSNWRSLFVLTAASRTGKNRPTSAVCTYADSGDQLVCEFENPGHRSEVDGLIVPARPTATYTVNVSLDVARWSIHNANGGPYSARDLDLCQRGGQGTGHDGGHDSGHEPLTDGIDEAQGEGQGDGTVPCEHVVVIQKIPVVVPEPEPEPEPEPPTETTAPAPAAEPEPEPEPPTTPAEPAAPDTAQDALSPIAPTATATPRALPATGSSISMMLAVGTVLAAIGVGLALLARRATPDPIGGRVDERGRMPA